MNRKPMIAFTLVLLLGALAPNAVANADNKETLFRITNPVEIPGGVLPPGRYDIRLQGNGSPTAGIWSADGLKFYGYFETMLVDRARGMRGSEIVFDQASNAPMRLEEWFYPGSRVGNELLYPKNEQVRIAGLLPSQANANR